MLPQLFQLFRPDHSDPESGESARPERSLASFLPPLPGTATHRFPPPGLVVTKVRGCSLSLSSGRSHRHFSTWLTLRPRFCSAHRRSSGRRHGTCFHAGINNNNWPCSLFRQQHTSPTARLPGHSPPTSINVPETHSHCVRAILRWQSAHLPSVGLEVSALFLGTTRQPCLQGFLPQRWCVSMGLNTTSTTNAWRKFLRPATKSVSLTDSSLGWC